MHNKKFQELSPKLQNRVEDCNLVLYVIDAKVPVQALLDIFERVNSGEPLTRQQMRNCLFTGPSTRFLKEEAHSDLFKQATGNSLDPDSMRDREFINRFCAFHLLGTDFYKGDMDDFLAQALERMNGFEPVQFEKLSSELRTSLKNNLTVFGKHAFRKHIQGKESRSVINASLWDVMSTGLSRYSDHLVEARRDSLWAAFYRLLNNEEFIESITLGTNQVNRVKERFLQTNLMFKEVFDDFSN
ncbi:MAG: hypothetical protein HGB11_08275 [Chlorobiales bacterium]|nr:hypothetical protein [Chlorobiales bacterium]